MAKKEVIEVREIFNNGVWNEGKLKATVSKEMYQHIIENIKMCNYPVLIRLRGLVTQERVSLSNQHLTFSGIKGTNLNGVQVCGARDLLLRLRSFYGGYGASKGNPGQSAYGFCIRNREEDLIYAEAESIGLVTNIEAEIHAIWKGLQFCLSQAFVQVRLETNYLVLKNMIIRNWRIPWELVEKMEEIQEMIHQMNVQVKHISREANMLADCIANTSVYTVEKQEFHNFNQLTSMGRRIHNIDK